MQRALQVRSKFDYVVSCQKYGDQRRHGDPKAADVDLLLQLYPGLSVVYVDRTPTFGARVGGQQGEDGADVFDSVLLKADEKGSVVERCRIRLPQDPILGEGKPENQNIGLPFTRGEKVALIDMNQEGYFEQAYCTRNTAHCILHTAY